VEGFAADGETEMEETEEDTVEAEIEDAQAEAEALLDAEARATAPRKRVLKFAHPPKLRPTPNVPSARLLIVAADAAVDAASAREAVVVAATRLARNNAPVLLLATC